MTQSQSIEKQDFVIKALPLFFVAMTLRPLTTSVGPVLPEIREDFGLSATAGSLLSTLPILMFGLGALFVPRLLHRISPNKAISLSLLALAVGGHLRLLPFVVVLYLGTIIIGLGVAVGRRQPPQRLPQCTVGQGRHAHPSGQGARGNELAKAR
jgi:CP family cyanate transporter-like MFS transporter